MGYEKYSVYNVLPDKPKIKIGVIVIPEKAQDIHILRALKREGIIRKFAKNTRPVLYLKLIEKG